MRIKNDVGLLARRDRADLLIESAGPRAVDRGKFQNIAMRQRRSERRIRCFGESEDALLDERRAHLREHLTRHARHDVNAERRPDASRNEPARRRHAMSHQHFDEWRYGRRSAGFGNKVQLLVGGVRAVNVRRIRSHQPEFIKREHMMHVNTGQPHPDVHADANAEIARQQPIVPRDVGRRVAGSARRKRERQELVVGLKVLLSDASNVFGMLQRAISPPLVAYRERRARTRRECRPPSARRPPRLRAPACC